MGIEMMTKGELEELFKDFNEELRGIKQTQEEILGKLDRIKTPEMVPEFMPAMEFMKAVGIKRWKFDQLVAENMIKTVKKKRKVYVAVREVKRYFIDPTIQ
jgi:hypothetical protein